MKQVYSYSHLGGEEILMVRYPKLFKEIEEIIELIPAIEKTKKSKEKSKKGRLLYSPSKLNNLFKKEFSKRGWNEGRDYFDIELPNYSHIVKGSYKQWDFLKEDVIVEVQFGKYAFMFYDLAKFQYFFNQGVIQLGIEIVPCHILHNEMSSGVSYGEQLIYDIERIGRNFPSVPVRIILVDMPINSSDYSIEERKEIHNNHEKKMEEFKKIIAELGII